MSALPPKEDDVDEVLRFWFEETRPKQWFEKDEAFDAEVRRRFLVLHDRETFNNRSVILDIRICLDSAWFRRRSNVKDKNELI